MQKQPILPPKVSHARKHLSREELAKLEKRFRERRQQEKDDPEKKDNETLLQQQRGRHIILASLLLGIILLAGMYRFSAEPPKNVAIAEAPRPAPFFKKQARPPRGCVEVRSTMAPLTGLARGSRLAQELQKKYSVAYRFPIEIENSIGMRFRLIPPGTYVQGSPLSEPGRGPDEEEHVVQIRVPFYMGKYEVTQKEWNLLMGAKTNPSWFRDPNGLRPVEEVSWWQVQKFIAKLCEREKVPKGSYRLPLEKEWEYACRAGTQTPFYCGHTSSELGRFEIFEGTSHNGTDLVGLRPPNAWGLHDMLGNVWEWCYDRFTPYLKPTEKDPLRRVIRGGNWRMPPNDCRSASRFRLPPASKGNILGFRLVRLLPLSLLKLPKQTSSAPSARVPEKTTAPIAPATGNSQGKP